MNRNFAIAIIVILVVLAGAAGYTLTRNNQAANTSSTSNTAMPNMSTAPQSNTQSPATTESVSIKDMAFTPASITVKKGATVTWTNNDSIAHTVVETDGQTGPDSSALESGATYSFAYKTAGTYRYHCSIHPNMTGTVVVTE